MPKIRGRPVPDVDLEFEWNQGTWETLFNAQVALIREDIYRARVADRFVIYLSCPISGRGGSSPLVNVDIAQFTERRLMQRFGERVWILNPAQYQMESKEGTGLIRRHARAQGISDSDLERLVREQPVGGGDYMRMWTKILFEDTPIDAPTAKRLPLANSGRYFDAFYFLGPSDITAFFGQTHAGGTAGAVETYFARRYETDPDFRAAFSVSDVSWGSPLDAKIQTARDEWESLRKDLIRYYTLKASAAFSKGSHDEWNIALKINQRRLESTKGNVGELLAVYSDGVLVDLSDFDSGTYPGYAI